MKNLHVLTIIILKIAFPTMAAIITNFDMVSPFMANPNFPEISPFQMLHAEQRI